MPMISSGNEPGARSEQGGRPVLMAVDCASGASCPGVPSPQEGGDRAEHQPAQERASTRGPYPLGASAGSLQYGGVRGAAQRRTPHRPLTAAGRGLVVPAVGLRGRSWMSVTACDGSAVDRPRDGGVGAAAPGRPFSGTTSLLGEAPRASAFATASALVARLARHPSAGAFRRRTCDRFPGRPAAKRSERRLRGSTCRAGRGRAARRSGAALPCRWAPLSGGRLDRPASSLRMRTPG